MREQYQYGNMQVNIFNLFIPPMIINITNNR
jgi:hypothetical protein